MTATLIILARLHSCQRSQVPAAGRTHGSKSALKFGRSPANWGHAPACSCDRVSIEALLFIRMILGAGFWESILAYLPRAGPTRGPRPQCPVLLATACSMRIMGGESKNFQRDTCLDIFTALPMTPEHHNLTLHAVVAQRLSRGYRCITKARVDWRDGLML